MKNCYAAYSAANSSFFFLILYLNNFYSLLLTKLQSKIFQSEFLNFTTACHRELLHKKTYFGIL